MNLGGDIFKNIFVELFYITFKCSDETELLYNFHSSIRIILHGEKRDKNIESIKTTCLWYLRIHVNMNIGSSRSIIPKCQGSIFVKKSSNRQIIFKNPWQTNKKYVKKGVERTSFNLKIPNKNGKSKRILFYCIWPIFPETAGY